MKKSTKEMLRQPDWFMAHVAKVWKLMMTGRGAVLSIIAVLFFGGLAYSAYSTFKDSREAKAQELVFAAEKSYEVKKADFEKAEVPKKDNDKNKKDEIQAPASPVATGDLIKDYGDVVEQYEKVLKDYANSQAAMVAAIHLGRLYGNFNQPQKGIDVLKPYDKDATGGNLLKLSVKLTLGYLLDQSGKCEDAIKYYDVVAADQKATYFKSEALLKSAFCYDTLGNRAKAEEIMQTLSKDYSEAGAGKAAKKYLRLLKISSSS